MPHEPGSPRKAKTPRDPKAKPKRPRAGAMVLGNPYEGAGNNQIIVRRRKEEILRQNQQVLEGITNAESRYSRAALAKKVEAENVIKNRLRRIRVGWSKPMPRKEEPTPPKKGRNGSATPRTAPGGRGGRTDRATRGSMMTF